MFEGKVFCGKFYFQVFMSCWRIQQSIMNIFCSLWTVASFYNFFEKGTSVEVCTSTEVHTSTELIPRPRDEKNLGRGLDKTSVEVSIARSRVYQALDRATFFCFFPNALAKKCYPGPRIHPMTISQIDKSSAPLDFRHRDSARVSL